MLDKEAFSADEKVASGPSNRGAGDVRSALQIVRAANASPCQVSQQFSNEDQVCLLQLMIVAESKLIMFGND